jgi:hypothetical protein
LCSLGVEPFEYLVANRSGHRQSLG